MTNMFKKFFRLFFTGFTMGSADIVPGVSGGTIAFIFGIYEELIFSIKKMSTETISLLFKGKIKQAIQSVPFSFLVPLGLGILTAILTLTGVLSHLLETSPVRLWSFFFGLVLASVFLVSKRIANWNFKDIISMLIFTVIAYLVVGSVPLETAATPLAFLLSGAIAICAMILPGISGSFLLIIMGKYEQILTAVNNKDIFTLGLVVVGAVLGLALFSRLLSWLFKNHHNIVVASLTGFMIGSLRKIWPWKETITTRINSHGNIIPLVQQNVLPENFNGDVIVAISLCIFAIVLILILDKFQFTKEKISDLDDKKI